MVTNSFPTGLMALSRIREGDFSRLIENLEGEDEVPRSVRKLLAQMMKSGSEEQTGVKYVRHQNIRDC
ncbi:MAG: hypothetical protein CMM08_05655 [Rhodospirillaceae bacterium]|jgi:hypothetical protein|nr:hypothetical protein [Rhodospirillaceae bacterium]